MSIKNAGYYACSVMLIFTNLSILDAAVTLRNMLVELQQLAQLNAKIGKCWRDGVLESLKIPILEGRSHRVITPRSDFIT
jgi:hypothetical protein